MRIFLLSFLCLMFVPNTPVMAQAPAVQSATEQNTSAAGMDLQAKVSGALTEYGQKHYGRAADMLIEAANYLRALKAETLKPFLPAAPEGWNIVEEGKGIGSDFLGMGSTLERQYQSTSQKIRVGFLTDNKIMSLVGGLSKLSGSFVDSKQDNGKSYKGYTYMYKIADPNKKWEKDNTITLLTSDKLTISVSGPNMTEAQGTAFLDKIDIEKLKIEADK